MSAARELRWQQRFETFGKALAQLTKACDREQYSELELAGLVKTFELAFELCWRVLMDMLSFEGFNVTSPRTVLRASFDMGLIDERNCEILLEALEKRTLPAHVYFIEAEAAEALIKESFHPALVRLYEILNAKQSQ